MQYDVVILGGGPGGYVAAIKAAQLGGKVLLIEKENLGGVCLNKGCIPTKTLLKSSGMYKSIKESSRYGIDVEGVAFDFVRMMDRKNEVVMTLVNGIKGLLRANKVEVVKGEGKIIDPSHVKVGSTVYETSNIIIATGSRPFMPRIKGIESPNVLNSDGLLSIKELPSSMVIIGGGVIGIEFATLLSELGCKVTIVEMMDEILNMADDDVIEAVKGVLKENSVEIITSAKVCEINMQGVVYEKDNALHRVDAEKVLVASGRTPNTNAEELDALQVKHERGKILTNDKMETNIKGIYAIGDVNGKFMLAHVASEEGIVAVENIFGHEARMSYKSIPQCLYLHPEVAWIGMTERDAREKGYDVGLGVFPISANGKSLAEGDTRGFIKVIVDKKYNEVLGIHMVCSHATDMIAEGVLAINIEATAKEIALSIHPHPTVSEAVMEAANAALGKAIHIV